MRQIARSQWRYSFEHISFIVYLGKYVKSLGQKGKVKFPDENGQETHQHQQMGI
jgi:hypothetical protein